jgi:hypothetical protein
MATYLQGVTDYIPQYQPFQPDLNFYGNVLQTKQTQYDTNWKSLNKMYSQYYNADLTRDVNVEKKNNYLKQIEFNLQRVSQLDLSLEQNVDQATQVFKPFYEDKGLVKDMAWTKNFNNNYSKAMSFKGAYDEKLRNQYWDTGVKEMEYLKDEFKNASDAKAMTFGNVEYTPYVNVVEKAQKIAKDANLSIESVDFSKDGRWIVKTKNGEQLTEPLSKLFEAELGNDPAVQSIYKTQAYVNRKDYAYSNAAQFGGDKDAAEMKYLENSFNLLKAQTQQRYVGIKQRSIAYQAQIEDLENQIKNGNASPQVKTMLAQYQMNKDINDKALERVETEQKQINGGQSSTVTTTTGFQNPYGDIESLRWKVDNGMASNLMQKDLDEAANIFAYSNSKVDIDANPYALNDQKHAQNMQAVAARNAGLARAAQIRNQGEMQKTIMKARLDAGTHYIDEQTGELKPFEAFETTFVDPNDKGTATDKMNLKNTSTMIAKMQTDNVAKPYLQNTLSLIERLVDQKVMTKADAANILGHSKNPKMDYKTFSERLNSNPYTFIRSTIGAQDLAKIRYKMGTWLGANGQLSGLTGEEFANYKKSAVAFGDYTKYLEADQSWRKSTSKEVTAELKHQGFKAASQLYNEKGELRSKKEFNNAISHLGLSGDYDEMVSAAGAVYTSGRVKKAPPGIASLGTMEGTGKFTPGTTSIYVNPKAHGTKSSAIFGEVVNDLNKFDWGATDKNRVTFDGISKTSFDKRAEEGFRNEEGKALLNAIRGEMNNPKTKMGNFKIGVSPVAAGTLNKAAIIIHPDAEWLKSKVFTTNSKGEKTGTGMISAAQYDLIMKNGISYITDSKSINGNSLYKSAYQSPLQSYVDYKGSYTYEDPADNRYKYTISKSTVGSGDYKTTIQYPLWNAELGKETIHVMSENVSTQGNNLEMNRDDYAFSTIPEIMTSNKERYNGNY